MNNISYFFLSLKIMNTTNEVLRFNMSEAKDSSQGGSFSVDRWLLFVSADWAAQGMYLP